MLAARRLRPRHRPSPGRRRLHPPRRRPLPRPLLRLPPRRQPQVRHHLPRRRDRAARRPSQVVRVRQRRRIPGSADCKRTNRARVRRARTGTSKTRSRRIRKRYVFPSARYFFVSDAKFSFSHFEVVNSFVVSSLTFWANLRVLNVVVASSLIFCMLLLLLLFTITKFR